MIPRQVSRRRSGGGGVQERDRDRAADRSGERFGQPSYRSGQGRPRDQSRSKERRRHGEDDGRDGRRSGGGTRDGRSADGSGGSPSETSVCRKREREANGSDDEGRTPPPPRRPAAEASAPASAEEQAHVCSPASSDAEESGVTAGGGRREGDRWGGNTSDDESDDGAARAAVARKKAAGAASTSGSGRRGSDESGGGGGGSSAARRASPVAGAASPLVGAAKGGTKVASDAESPEEGEASPDAIAVEELAAAAASAAAAGGGGEDSASLSVDTGVDEIRNAFSKQSSGSGCGGGGRIPSDDDGAAKDVEEEDDGDAAAAGVGASVDASAGAIASAATAAVVAAAAVPADNYNPLINGCRSVETYENLFYIAEGVYGKVFCARNRVNGEIVALKQVKYPSSPRAREDGFPITALRETNVMLSLHHPNVVGVREMVVHPRMKEKVYMVMPYYGNDLKSAMDKMRAAGAKWETRQVKCLLRQLLAAIEYCHRHWYVHRDLKASNLLYEDGHLAVCDFGLARKYEDPLHAYTPEVVTPIYRPPELFLGQRLYSTEVDMWSVGCIFGEMLLLDYLFRGESDAQILESIFKTLGAPTEERWPGWSQLPNAAAARWKLPTASRLRAKFPAASFSGGATLSEKGFDLLSRLLELDPKKRISGAEALRHPWFEEHPPQAQPHQMPRFPSKRSRMAAAEQASAAAMAAASAATAPAAGGGSGALGSLAACLGTGSGAGSGARSAAAVSAPLRAPSGAGAAALPP